MRKVFLGIKGVYYEIDAPGQGGDAVPVRWLEGYEFQQHVPHDVDFRILLTFLELYRTLISFVLFKLYTEENLVYPPPLDVELDEQGESVGALRLVERKEETGEKGEGGAETGKTVSKKEVKKAIRGIKVAKQVDADMDEEMEDDGNEDVDEEFVERPSKTQVDDVATAPLTTYSTLIATSSTSNSSRSLLFAPYTFYLSRETSSRTWEFVVRAIGGKVITCLSASSPDAAKEADTITHVIIDRPMTNERMREMESGRKWVWIQPQWIADCVNRGKVLGSNEYGPGKLLPPHLSPWEGEGELNRPWLEENAEAVAGIEDDAEDAQNDGEADEDEDSEREDEETTSKETTFPPALLAASLDPTDPALIHAAELEAEKNGTSHGAFQTQLKEAIKTNSHLATSKPASSTASATKTIGGDEDLRKIMMSNKKAKLYEKMTYGNNQRAEEVCSSLIARQFVLAGTDVLPSVRNLKRREWLLRRGRIRRGGSEGVFVQFGWRCARGARGVFLEVIRWFHILSCMHRIVGQLVTVQLLKQIAIIRTPVDSTSNQMITLHALSEKLRLAPSNFPLNPIASRKMFEMVEMFRNVQECSKRREDISY